MTDCSWLQGIWGLKVLCWRPDAAFEAKLHATLLDCDISKWSERACPCLLWP